MMFMKTKHFFSLLTVIGLSSTISFAQNAGNQNPYAIFGSEPYIAGAKAADAEVKVFVIENFAEGSTVARLEHNTTTGVVTYFDKAGNVLGQKQLKEGERAWPSIDKKAEQYYSISPYAFCANNPVKYIDPNGMEVWIYYQDDDGNEQKMLYTANMNYSGSNSFVSNMVGNLNAVYGNGGNTMLDALIGSSNAFNVLNQNPSIEGAGGAFRRNMDGGGTIFAGLIGGEVNFSNVETTAHEFFHGAQHEFGQGGSSVFNEVEAYVFGYGVAMNYGNSTGNYGGSMTPAGVGGTPASDAWESSFRSLQTNGYSPGTMVNAINNFQAGAAVNSGGQYNRIPALPTPYNGGKPKSILSGFWRP